MAEDSTRYMVAEIPRRDKAWSMQLDRANGIIREQSVTIAELHYPVPWYLAALGGGAVGIIVSAVLIVSVSGD